MQIDSRQSASLGNSVRSNAAIATYRSAITAAAKLPASNGNYANSFVTDKVSVSTAGQTLMNEAAKNPKASDPFRGFRDENGNLSMSIVMEMQMLPPKLREAAKGMREVASLGKEIAAMEANPGADSAKLESLRAEYAAAKGKLEDDLEKAGLSEKMRKAGITIDQLLQSEGNILVRLSNIESVSDVVSPDTGKKTATGATATRTTATRTTATGTTTGDAATPDATTLTSDTAQSIAAVLTMARTGSGTGKTSAEEEQKPSLLTWMRDAIRRKLLAASGAEPIAA